MNYNVPLPETESQRLAIKLSTQGERLVREGHPWIFSDRIEKVNQEGTAGDIAIIFSHKKNKVLGVGLYDPASPIRIKMLYNGGGAQLNATFFAERIAHAFAIRTELLTTKTNSYRLLFGENDGFPGLIADVYDHVLVVKLYSAIWIPFLKDILDALLEVSECSTLVVRLSRTLQQLKSFPLKDGQVLYGTLENEVVRFTEHGINFSANVIKGHKTGYFLDHRHNRKRVGELARGKRVLDVFSYAGGFSVHALAGGAAEVTSLDISKQALQVASENVLLNPIRGKHHTIAGDAFVEMQQMTDAQKLFDVVVIDPPSFAKSKKEISGALKKYKQLTRLGAQLTAAGGMLVLASCSSRVSADEFYELTNETLQQQPRKFKLELKTGHDVDHPITFNEGAYLKCVYYKCVSSF